MTLSMIGKTCDLTEKKAGTAWGNPIYVAIFPSKVIDSDLFLAKGHHPCCTLILHKHSIRSSHNFGVFS